ncbi:MULTISPECIES: cytidine deaminase-like fold-containing protein [Xanthomonas]|uniref:cytidine deaminase-like fold-containing protein n=1 Tax=Xanthomonas TaxID=338 RepID=UPI000E1E91D2|nr:MULTISPECIES: hypothetical protein [Xanthomonas]
MAKAHTEISVIQQAYDAGKTKNADMVINVKGKNVCGCCKGDIAAAAQKAGLNSLAVKAVDARTGVSTLYSWTRGMKVIESDDD